MTHAQHGTKLCKISFAVPSLSMLEQLHTDTPKLIFPSIFEGVLIHLERLQEVHFKVLHKVSGDSPFHQFCAEYAQVGGNHTRSLQ